MLDKYNHQTLCKFSIYYNYNQAAVTPPKKAHQVPQPQCKVTSARKKKKKKTWKCQVAIGALLDVELQDVGSLLETYGKTLRKPDASWDSTVIEPAKIGISGTWPETIWTTNAIPKYDGRRISTWMIISGNLRVCYGSLRKLRKSRSLYLENHMKITEKRWKHHEKIIELCSWGSIGIHDGLCLMTPKSRPKISNGPVVDDLWWLEYARFYFLFFYFWTIYDHIFLIPFNHLFP